MTYSSEAARVITRQGAMAQDIEQNAAACCIASHMVQTTRPLAYNVDMTIWRRYRPCVTTIYGSEAILSIHKLILSEISKNFALLDGIRMVPNIPAVSRVSHNKGQPPSTVYPKRAPE